MAIGHKPLAPSFSSVWTKCSAAPTVARHCLELHDSEAIEGDVGHEICYTCLQYDVEPEDFEGRTINGVVIDHDFVQACKVFVDYCRSPSTWQYFEHTLAGNPIHEDTGGTPDCVKYYDQTLLEVADLKMGFEAVRPEENTQLLLYAIFFYYQILLPRGGRVTHIRLTIIQPRSFKVENPIMSWDFEIARLETYITWLQDTADRTTWPNPEYTPGRHCKHCPGKMTCPAYTNWIQQPFPVAPGTLSDEQLISLLELASTVKQLEKDLRAEGMRRSLLRNKPLPGYKVVKGVKHRKTRADQPVIDLIRNNAPACEEFGTDSKYIKEAFTDPKLKTPAQLEKTFPQLKDQLQEHFYTPEGQQELVPLSDNRPAIVTAADYFKTKGALNNG